MGEAASLRDKSLGVEADLQAFDYARSRAGDVTELFDILAAKLRPGSKDPSGGEIGEGGKTFSGKSTLQAHYHGSSGSTVLSTANLKRIQTFLDEPQKHLGQVFADIEKEAGSFYDQVSSIKKAPGAGVQRMQRGALHTPLMGSKEACFEDVPEMNKYLGPTSRFGDGDGSFWDRWLTTTGHFSEEGNYSNAGMPTRSMYSKGSVIPHSGFKRYQLDKLAFARNPEPRVLTYEERRDLDHEPGHTDVRKRLRGANSERCLSPGSREWLEEAVLSNTSMAGPNGERRASKEGFVGCSKSTPTLPGVSGSRSKDVQETETSTRAGDFDEQEPPSVLAALRDKIRTIGAIGERGTISDRSVTWSMAMKEEVEKDEAQTNGSSPRKPQVTHEVVSGHQKQSMEGAVTGLGLVHPNYFGRRARTHVYEYYKQVSRRRHQYGDQKTMTSIPLTPVVDFEVVPGYKAGVDAVQSSMEEVFGSQSHELVQEKKATRKSHLLPPLRTPGGRKSDEDTEGGSGGVSAEGGSEKDNDSKGEEDRKKRLEEAGSFAQVTSRTRYLMRCMERGVAPRAHIIIRKTHTTKVNLAHQGMGDVMGSILADCLAGLPLMRELNLRDNRLTDKGLIPIVKAIRRRHDLISLDLSENKLDRWAARELALYFADPLCTLAKFVLSKADVDDFEAANLVTNMKLNKTLTYLDISYNLIGTQESINYVRPEFYTGAEALADWISTEGCALTHLDVSWNTIRLDSAVYFGKALAHATKLVHLNLGFNCFGAKGGEAIGASLHVNTCLKTLGLESNAINPRACFVICQGLLCNSGMRRINLSNNALGKVGVGCVMALTAEIGDRMKANMSHCNFMVGCEECWFNDAQLEPSYTLRLEEPYDRAVAVHLVRRAARDEGLKLKAVAHTAVGEAEKEVDLVTGIVQSERPFDDLGFQEEIFRKYDKNGTGSLSSAELVDALIDLDVPGGNQVDLIMSQHGDGDGRIERAEFYEFVQTSTLQSRKREDRSKAFIADASKPTTRWVVPSEGRLRIDLDYQRLHHQGCHTSSESTDGMLALLSDIGDGLVEVTAHALDFVSLDIEQGLKTYTTIVKHMGGDKIKALAKVIPRMESPSDARLLKNTVLRDLDERRKLMLELGPAYRPLMGTPMGHYELDLARPMHQLAARKILEYNNAEKFARQTGSCSVFDASQKGNWENVRNECMNGKPFRFDSDILEPPPSAGLLELDYVSTTRRTGKGGRVAESYPVPMSVKRFQDVLHKVGLGEDEDWVNASEGDFEQAIDDALLEWPPRPRNHEMFEHLHFLYTGDGPSGVKAPIPSRPSTMDKQSGSRGHSQGGQSSGSKSGTPLDPTVSGLPSAGWTPPKRPQTGVTAHLTTGGEMHLEATVRLNAMAFRLEELIADRWFSTRQCRFVVLAIQGAFQGHDFLQDVLVDFVVTVYPRIVDAYDYSTLVACLEERSQAFVIKRVGWLAVWNACRPDGYIELAFDRREERQVAKMLVHLASQEPGENWASSSFRWAMYDQPTPGWLLPAALFTEAGMPSKGILTCTYKTRPGGVQSDWVLRMALTQAVSLCDPPAVGALVVADGITTDAGGGVETGGATASNINAGSNSNAGSSSSADCNSAAGSNSNTGRSSSAGSNSNTGRSSSAGGVEGRAGGGEERLAAAAGPGLEALEGLEGSFDREFVDVLCRQAGKGFFLYGTT